MNLLIALLALTTTVNWLLMILTVDAMLAIVSLHRITFAVVSTPFTRGKAFGIGSIVSPLLWIRAVPLTVLASILTSAKRSFSRRLLLISFCSRESVWCVSLYARARRRKSHESF